MDENQARKIVQGAMLRQEKLFDSSINFLLYKQIKPVPSNEGGVSYLTFYYPSRIDFDSVDGYKLKNGKGYISITETYLVKNKHHLDRVAFTYKFITDEVEYVCGETQT